MKAFLALLTVTLATAGADTNRPALTIDAGSSVFDLKNNLFLYTNDVTVFDPPARPGDLPTTLTCGWLTAKRGLGGKLETIVAHERVKIDQGDRHARGALAVYTATNEQMVLTGAFDPANTNTPPFPVLSTSQGTNYGPKIVYDRLNDQLLMPEGVTTIIPQNTLSNTNRDKTNKSVLNDKLLAPKPKSPPPN